MRRLFLLAGVLGAAAFACSSSDDDVAVTDAGTDSPSVLPAMDSSVADAAAASDAAPDVVVDAAIPICSTDNFCHSVVPKGQFLRGVWGDGTGVIWAVALEGDLLRWDGTAWKVYQHITDNEGGLYSIFGTSPTDIWIPSDKGLLHGTGASSATITFTPVTLPGDATVFIKSVWGTGPTNLWAVGGADGDDFGVEKGRAIHYNGTTWALDADLSARSISYSAVWGSAGTGVWVHGLSFDENFNENGVALRLLPATTAWKPLTIPDPSDSFHTQPQEFLAAALSSATSVWLGGHDGAFNPASWHGTLQTDGGIDWAFRDLGYFARPIFAYWGLAANDTWAVGQQGYVAHWDGTTWQPSITHVGQNPTGESIWAIWGTSNDDFWVVGDEIALHKTRAGKP